MKEMKKTATTGGELGGVTAARGPDVKRGFFGKGIFSLLGFIV